MKSNPRFLTLSEVLTILRDQITRYGGGFGDTPESSHRAMKNGNKHLAWAFIEAATFAVRFNPRIHSWYEKKKRKSGVPKAKKALACKLAKAAWHVMNGKEFDEALLFG